MNRMVDKQKLINRLQAYKEASEQWMELSETDEHNRVQYYAGRRDQVEWLILEVEEGDFDIKEEGDE